jgi:hypothetical protein
MDPEGGRRVSERLGDHFFFRLYQIYIKTASRSRRPSRKNVTRTIKGTEMTHLKQNCLGC